MKNYLPLLVACCITTTVYATENQAPGLAFEIVTLNSNGPQATIHLAWENQTAKRHPVILMTGELDRNHLPDWSRNLVREGFMLAAFTVKHAPDPNPARRPQWLFFDQRFAHGYTLGAMRMPVDAGRVIDYLDTRVDVDADKIGWLGSSSSGIPGLAVAAKEPRVKAIVAFVSTGAYRKWFETWKTNDLWQGGDKGLWPETLSILKEHDPIHHVKGLYPTAILLVCGSEDHLVDPKTTREFVNAARPFYVQEPERLRMVTYEGFGHNLPRDIIQMYAEHWFRLYLHPTNKPPEKGKPVQSMKESVNRTRINAAEHRKIVLPD